MRESSMFPHRHQPRRPRPSVEELEHARETAFTDGLAARAAERLGGPATVRVVRADSGLGEDDLLVHLDSGRRISSHRIPYRFLVGLSSYHGLISTAVDMLVHSRIGGPLDLRVKAALIDAG